MSSGRARRLSVLVGWLPIEDGEIEPPEVGAVIEFPLLFVEGVDGPGATTIRGTLEPSSYPPVQQERYPEHDTSEDPQYLWCGTLRGDGWAATWTGPRPRIEFVEVHGLFRGVMGIDSDSLVRGRIRRVRLVSQRYERLGHERSDRIPDHWIPVGEPVLTDVERSPRFFTDQRFDDDPPAIATRGEGVLVELDLDDVPEPPLRPEFVPAELSVRGDELWVLDRELPRIAIRGRESLRHLDFPAPVDARPTGQGRSLLPSPEGCWVIGIDGVSHVAGAGTSVRIGGDAVHDAAVDPDGLLLTCHASGRWALHRLGEETIDVVGPAGWPRSAIWDGHGFLVAVGPSECPSSVVELVRVASDGTTTGLRHDLVSLHRPSLLTAPLALADGDSVYPIGPDLELGTRTRLRGHFAVAGTVGEHVWIAGHLPDGTGRGGWWPLTGPPAFDCAGRRLLTLLDRADWTPVCSVPVDAPIPAVACDDAGTVWVVAGGRLRRLDVVDDEARLIDVPLGD
ncbi:MAG: hypothetical protein QM809_14120 [Gordonia sp. (in: high G+C Gram-positive bacteria)]|uniref:hypothetical protein n=1 Tax=Gordonia sp. (in: high G+C Gram-positive bacteria) TaxID=84139 RepID=UPI0039E45B54